MDGDDRALRSCIAGQPGEQRGHVGVLADAEQGHVEDGHAVAVLGRAAVASSAA